MSNLVGGIFNGKDRINMEALNQRLIRSQVINANVANAETPGFRALGYDFEKQLQAVDDEDDPMPMRITDDRHMKTDFVDGDGTIHPDVYVQPSESVGNDGNTVDVDKEMATLAENQIMYRATVELINRKIGVLKYAISAGGRG